MGLNMKVKSIAYITRLAIFVVIPLVSPQSINNRDIMIRSTGGDVIISGSKAILHCKVHSNFLIKFHWKFTSHSIADCKGSAECNRKTNSEVEIYPGEERGFPRFSDNVTGLGGQTDILEAVLSIRDTSKNDSGQYTCVGVTKRGNLTASTNLTVIDQENCSYQNFLPNFSSPPHPCYDFLNAVTELRYQVGARIGNLSGSESNTVSINKGVRMLQIFNQIQNDVGNKTQMNASYPDLLDIGNKTVNDFGNILINQDDWISLQNNERQNVFTEMIKTMESTSLNLAEKFAKQKNNRNVSFHFNDQGKHEDAVIIILKTTNNKEDIEMYADDKSFPRLTSVSVQISTKRHQEIQKPTNNQLSYAVTMIESEFVEDLTNNTIKFRNKSGVMVDDNSRQINAKLISFSLDRNTKINDSNITVLAEFVHSKDCLLGTGHSYGRKLHHGELRKAIQNSSICVFWDTKNNVWSTEGCVKMYCDKYKTVCKCNHLTAFSVMMRFYEYSGRDWSLEILAWVLCSLSILSLMVAIAVLLLETRTRNDERKATIHLCFTLLCGNILLFAGDRNNFYISDVVCSVLGVMSHFAWLCAFGWMAVEGIHLYHQVVQAFPSRSRHIFKIYSGVGYGIPTVIVAITFTVGFFTKEDSIYVGVMYCWLTGYYQLGFVVPVLVVVSGNIGILVKVVLIAKNKNNSFPKDESINNHKISKSDMKLIKGTMSLTVLLGASWILGVFTLVDFQGNIIFSYIFTIANASQGIFIFIFRCCLNNQTRQTMNKIFSDAISSFTKSTDYEGTTGTNISLEVNNGNVNQSSEDLT